jgi:hypothetical protein
LAIEAHPFLQQQFAAPQLPSQHAVLLTCAVACDPAPHFAAQAEGSQTAAWWTTTLPTA